jgi:hypothetical protein
MVTESHVTLPGPATREEGLRRLSEFLPRTGRAYADKRNYDFGPEQRSNVSMLSPWIRHRLITEAEILSAVLKQHSAAAADMFIQEVCWRSYWKGWLELRPTVWTDYRDEVEGWLARMPLDHGLRRNLSRATDGATGIPCFDHWVGELVNTGYLHNHARMWFASIWIFTLQLPWALGADFFLRHLLDGDIASNTLSWRWVAGLQTPGKTYLARPDNIERFTAGRFSNVSGLAQRAEPVPGELPPPPGLLPSAQLIDHREPSLLLLTDEDLGPEPALLADVPIKAVAGFVHPEGRSPLPVSPTAGAFSRAALADGLQRAARAHQAPVQRFSSPPAAQDVVDWAREHGCTQVVTAYAPVGPVQDFLETVEIGLAASGLPLLRARRRWDSHLWPLARRGFFPFKQHIAPLLDELGIAG